MEEQRPLADGHVRELGGEQVDGALVHRSGDILIACDTQQHPQGPVPNQHRGLLGKLADAFFSFSGYHRVGEPFRNRLRD